jgi:hypothetical protein
LNNHRDLAAAVVVFFQGGEGQDLGVGVDIGVPMAV